ANHGTSGNNDNNPRSENHTSNNKAARILKGVESMPHSFPYLVYVRGHPDKVGKDNVTTREKDTAKSLREYAPCSISMRKFLEGAP
ncbi:unnamed protein product, partial [Allacma fusca]